MSDERAVTRREFLRAAGAVGAAGAAGLGPLLAAREASAQTLDGAGEKEAREKVPTRLFGKTGERVSILGLGGMFDIPNNQIVLERALERGVNYWDTADCYEGGRSEEGIGEYFARKPEARKKVFLVTKSDRRDPAGMTSLLERSLDRMKIDRVDLYFLHGLKEIDELGEEVRSWAERAKKQGKIRFFGFSCHSNMEDNLLAASQLGWVDGIMATCNFRNMGSDRMKAALEACAKAGIGLTAMKTQAKGPRRGEGAPLAAGLERFLGRGFTEPQAKLKAVWEDPRIASICSQMPNLTILKANVAAALDRAKLSSAERKALEEHARATSESYCAGCARICERAVGSAVPVRDLMRQLMYYRAYGEPELARSLFAALPEDVRGRLAGLDYAEAEKACPQRLPIGALVREAAAVLA